jgi:glycosyltransferase involved in cell wall biosynthesis
MHSMSGPAVSVIVPVYNSESHLPLLVERLEPVLRGHTSQFELILVEDGSRDSSWVVVQTPAMRHPFITGIKLMRNYGQHNAILCGIRAARHEVIVTIDDDLQTPRKKSPLCYRSFRRTTTSSMGNPVRNSMDSCETLHPR